MCHLMNTPVNQTTFLSSRRSSSAMAARKSLATSGTVTSRLLCPQSTGLFGLLLRRSGSKVAALLLAIAMAATATTANAALVVHYDFNTAGTFLNDNVGTRDLADIADGGGGTSPAFADKVKADNGTRRGAVQLAGGVNNAFNYLENNDGAFTLPNFTVSYWALTDTSNQGNFKGLFSSGNTGELQFDSNSGVYRGITDVGTVNFANPVVVDQWNHIALTYDGTNTRWYYNGAEVAGSPIAGNPDNSIELIRIGANRAIDNGFAGFIDDFRIYDTALLAADISSEATSGFFIPEPSTALLLGLGLIGLVARRKRGGAFQLGPAAGDRISSGLPALSVCLLIATPLIGFTSNAEAAVIVSSDFDGNTITGGGTGMTVTWTGNEMGSASDLTAISPGAGFAVVGGLSTANNAFINHNLNTAPLTDPRGYSFSFTTGQAGYMLTDLQIIAGHLNGAGGDQTSPSDLTVSITNGGTIFTETRTINYASAPALKTQDYDLTGLTLSPGSLYTLTVTANNMPGGGAFIAFDGVTLQGNAHIPEPSTALLLGLGLVGFAALRRRGSKAATLAIAMLLTSALSPAANAALVGHWTFNDGSGFTAADSSGNGNTGALTPANATGPQWDTSDLLNLQPGGQTNTSALAFDGTGDTVQITGYKGVTGTASRTIAAWIKTSVVNDAIVTWGANVAQQKFVVRLNDSGANGTIGGLRLELNGGFQIGSTVLNDNEWHHIALTWEDDGTPDVQDTLLYVDGVLDTISGSQSVALNTASGQDVRIGNDPFSASRDWTGLLDDVRIYDEVLSALAIGQLATVVVPEPSTALLLAFGLVYLTGCRRKMARLAVVLAMCMLLIVPAAASAATISLEHSADADSDGNGTWTETLQTLNPGTFDAVLTGVAHGPATGVDKLFIQNAFTFTAGDTAFMPDYSAATGDPTNNDASLEFWFRPNDLTGTETVWETGGATDGSSLTLNGSTLQFIAKDGGVDGVVTTDLTGADLDGWYNAFVTIDITTDTLSLYVNGLLADSASLNGALDWGGTDDTGFGSVNAAIGGDTGSLGSLAAYSTFLGEFAVTRFYQEVVTAGEIRDLFGSAVIPEPSTALLLGLGLVGLVARRRRRLPVKAIAALLVGASLFTTPATLFAVPIEEPILNGLVTWFRADDLGLAGGATVTTIVDRTATGSGRGDNISQDAALTDGGPTYQVNVINGRSVVRNGGGGGYTYSGTMGLSGSEFTMFMVANNTGATGSSERALQIGGNAAGAGVGFDIDSAGMRYNNGNRLFNESFDASFHLGVWQMDNSDNYGSAFFALDGTTATESSVTNPGNTLTFADAGYTVGRGTNTGGSAVEFHSGDLAEFLVYNRALTAYEINFVGAYLEERFALNTAYFNAIPEPSTALLLGLGLIGLVARRRRR